MYLHAAIHSISPRVAAGVQGHYVSRGWQNWAQELGLQFSGSGVPAGLPIRVVIMTGGWSLQEELRALRTAVQLMVKRAEEKSAAQPLLQPASSAMEPIQEGGSEADGSGPDGSASSPAEEATPDSAQARAALPQAPEPHAPAEVSHCRSLESGL